MSVIERSCTRRILAECLLAFQECALLDELQHSLMEGGQVGDLFRISDVESS